MVEDISGVDDEEVNNDVVDYGAELSSRITLL